MGDINSILCVSVLQNGQVKFKYSLRASVIHNGLVTLSSVHLLIHILGTPLNDKQWFQVSLGRLDIRGAEDIAGITYSCSYDCAKPLIRKLLDLGPRHPQ